MDRGSHSLVDDDWGLVVGLGSWNVYGSRSLVAWLGSTVGLLFLWRWLRFAFWWGRLGLVSRLGWRVISLFLGGLVSGLGWGCWGLVSWLWGWHFVGWLGWSFGSIVFGRWGWCLGCWCLVSLLWRRTRRFVGYWRLPLLVGWSGWLLSQRL